MHRGIKICHAHSRFGGVGPDWLPYISEKQKQKQNKNMAADCKIEKQLL